MKETARWISVQAGMPEDDRQVVVFLDYRYKNMTDKTMMYRQNGSWFYVGSNIEYKGDYITHWLDLKNP